jgi:hypothetical protein
LLEVVAGKILAVMVSLGGVVEDLCFAANPLRTT